MAFAKKVLSAATAAVTVLAAGSAMALSCARPNIEQSYGFWDKAPETYYIVSATLTPAAPLPPVPSMAEANGNRFNPDLRGVYRVQGQVIGAQNSSPIDHYIWVKVGCAGPWCGQFPTAGTSGVMALKQLPDRTLELGIGACPGAIYDDGDGSATTRVRQCLQGNCAPQGDIR